MPIAEPAVTHQTLTPRDPVHRADSVETQELHPPDAVDDGRFPSNMSLDSDAVSPSGSDHGTPSDRPQYFTRSGLGLWNRLPIRKGTQQQCIWPEPESCIGRFLGTKGAFIYWEATGRARSTFKNDLSPRISELLKDHSFAVDGCDLLIYQLYMVGRQPESAVPHVMFSNPRRQIRVKAMKLLVKSKMLESYPGIRAGEWIAAPHIGLQQLTTNPPLLPELPPGSWANDETSTQAEDWLADQEDSQSQVLPEVHQVETLPENPFANATTDELSAILRGPSARTIEEAVTSQPSLIGRGYFTGILDHLANTLHSLRPNPARPQWPSRLVVNNPSRAPESIDQLPLHLDPISPEGQGTTVAFRVRRPSLRTVPPLTSTRHEDHVATCGAVFVVGDVKYCLLPAHTFQKRQVESGKRESEGSSKHDDEEGFTFGGFDEEQNQHSSQEDYQEEGDKDDVLRTPYRDSRATTSDSTGPKQPKPQSHEARYEKSDTPHLTLEPGIGNCLTASGDLDYALLETDMDLTDHPQLPILKPFTISDIPDTETAVTTVTSASGVVEGILTGESVMVRLNGGANFQRVFVVELDHPIQPGDSGSIVRDKANNMIYGHIVAGSKDTNFGLVVSANTVMEDFIRWLLSKARTQIRLRRQE